jgi:signal transduction histidine kinase
MKRSGKTRSASRNSARPRQSEAARPATLPVPSEAGGGQPTAAWDGTERRRERIRLQEMGHLAASIAHELRQPLSAIQNLAYFLKATLSPAEQKVQENLVLLEQQAELAGRILSNLVAFGRSGTPHRTSVQLDGILTEVLKRIAWPAQARLELPLKQKRGQRPPRVFADPLHVDRILSNLIMNGLESMDGAGTLSISMRAGQDGGKRACQGYVSVGITDTGCGIRPEQARDIFRAFVTTKPSGTGLGLALCLELAEANGGSITFHSRPGSGTTFELRLPRA